jgi:hypothetical protein
MSVAESPSEAIVDGVLDQVYYRGPGLVPTHLGVGATHDAAAFLSQNGRGGTVTWVVPGRAFVWLGIIATPGFPDSETMDALFAGSGIAQLNTYVVRLHGFVTQELRRRFLGGS